MINIDIYTKNIGSKLDSPVLQYNKLPKTTLTKYQRRYIKEKEKWEREKIITKILEQKIIHYQ